MTNSKAIPRFPLFIGFTVIIFILDILLHNYLVIWALYFYPLYRVSAFGSKKEILILTVLSCFFLIACYLMFIDTPSPDIHLWNRLFGLTLLLIFSYLMLKKVRIENALEEAREEYSALFNTRSNAIGHFDIVTDESGKPVNIRYVKINEAYENIMNLKKADVEGKLLTEVFPGIENAPLDYIGRYGKIGVEGGELSFEDYFAPNDLWISAYVFSPQKNKIIVIFNDITDRKKTEQKLAETAKVAEEGKRTLVALLEHIPMGIIIAEVPEVNIKYISRTGKDFLEGRVNLLEGLSLDAQVNNWSLYRGASVKQAGIEELPMIRAVWNGEIIEHEEWVFVSSEDEKFYVLCTAAPIRDPAGQITGGVMGWQDITEQKRIEQKLNELNEQLISQNTETESAKMRWQSIVQSIPEEVWVCSPEGKIDLLNPGKASFLGLTEFSNRTLENILNELEILNPDGRPRPEEETPLLRSLNGEFVQGEEIMRNKKTGAARHRQYSSAPMRDSDGNVKGSVVIVTDITEQKMNEKKLAEALKELQRSNKELEQFAYTASHDLQEPIRMIKSYAALIDFKYNNLLDKTTQEYLGFISEGAARMQQLVDGLLTYSRINTKENLFEKIDCTELVKNVLRDLEATIKEAGAEIIVNDLPVITADKVQMRQVFQNLIQNSLKFRNNEKTIIEVSCERKGRLWRFSVKDNGIGIAREFLDRIFVIFQRLHTRDEYPGTGMGLSIVKKIVERHGGEVFVESEPGKGSVFYFTMPAGY